MSTTINVRQALQELKETRLLWKDSGRVRGQEEKFVALCDAVFDPLLSGIPKGASIREEKFSDIKKLLTLQSDDSHLGSDSINLSISIQQCKMIILQIIEAHATYM
ncbi:hypothetical protein KC865_02810 [Candidatus Kaiserbacteria bacterium]|nr:hypothetical protein [Candidatus Kaiserbacteria bacterium]USN92286.1 MAG: hypothetical protein H6782_00470 [Candidatus Nomurabacteria bacterium]